MSRKNYVFRNWSNTVVARPRRYVQPTGEDEIVRLVRQTRDRDGTVRVVGAGHSWTDCAACDDVMVNLDRMQRVVDVDYDNWQVTVQAGARLKNLIGDLDEHGMALQNVGSVTEQSIAGAVGTGTHGSGLAFGSLSTQLVRFRLVTGTGKVLEVSREETPDLYHAAAVSFGSLGIMTEVTLQVEPTYTLEENSFTMPFDAAVRLAPQLYSEHPRMKFWWLPHTGVVQVYTFDKTDAAPQPASAIAERFDAFMNDSVFTAVLGLGRRLPAAVPLLNRLVGASYFKSYTRVDRWDRILTVAMPPVHLENEYGLPVERTVEMMKRVKQLIDRNSLSVGFVNEIRFVRRDDNWLSPAYGRDSVQFGAYTPDGRDARTYLEGVEDLAYELGGRPHWGKDFDATPEQLRAMYPAFDDFCALRQELDPDRVFANAFVARVLGL